MISTERARRVLADIRNGPLLDLSPQRSEEIVAEALREARAHGALLVLHLLKTRLNPDDASLHGKLARLIATALEYDEKSSNERPVTSSENRP